MRLKTKKIERLSINTKMNDTHSKDKILEHCGVFGAITDDIGYSVSQLLYKGLMALQHRGQESSGISILKTGGKIYTYKKIGLVSKVLNPRIQSRLWGNVAIGHTRYATTGATEFESSDYMQPFHYKNNEVEFSFCLLYTSPSPRDRS